MERRNHQEMGNNPVGYTPPSQLMVHESPSPVNLPLAPILSTPPDNHRRPNAVPSARRGSSIFSPAHHHQTLDHHHHAFNPPRPPPHHQLSPIDDASASLDPDPTTPTAAAPSKSKSPPPADGNTSSIRYRECLKNHAASMGAHVVDGCGEFMPGGEDGTPDGLRCAACDCHRNFHRKDSDADRTPPQNLRLATVQQPRHRFASPPGMVSFGGAAESSSGHAAGRPSSLSSGSKKRFRTKFNQDQKDRMQEFAARVGWRIQKEDEEEVERFCGEVGVKRQVFKVWMHNNKQAIKKRSADTSDS